MTTSDPAPAQETIPAILTRDLHKVFPAPKGGATIEAVRGVDLRIDQGEIVALLGPNGAGKTTLLDMILGFVAPTSGSVAVLGGAPSAAIDRGAVSSVMQSGGLLPLLTVGETLHMVADLYGRRDAVATVARRAGVEALMDRRVSKCSGGEQQRLRFALALLPDPELLLLDEPTTGLDVAGRREFWNAIRADAASGRTVVFATHYLAEVDEIADRVVLLSHGRIVADGTPGAIKGAALGRVVRATLPVEIPTATVGRGRGSDELLRSLPGVSAFTRRGDVVELHTNDSDTLARHLLTATDARDVEITSTALDDAFVALTGSDPS